MQGYFYYFFDIGKAVLACTDPSLANYAPGVEYSLDTDDRLGDARKTYGLDGINLLMWRWLCATGVYHAAANTVSVEMIHKIGEAGGTVEEYLCQHQNVWNENERYFDRCAAGLGMIDAEHRLTKVMTGTCKHDPDKEPAEWELFQWNQFGPALQLSCDPASPVTGFAVAMKGCAEAFRMHFPCQPGALDYQICTGELFGEDVKKDGNIVPFHKLCGGHDMLRRMFECKNPAPHKPGTNMQLYALEWSKDHPGLPKPWNAIDFTMGTPVGVWGGWCTCPDGRVYQVGDEGNMCASVGCDGGEQGACYPMETEGAFRKVICATPDPDGTGARSDGSISGDAAATTKNVVTRNDATVGVWGGTCTCPDGQTYLVGDLLNKCASMACEGGVTGPCNHYLSHWKGVRVKCNTDPPLPPNRPPAAPPVSPPPLPPLVSPSPQSPPLLPPTTPSLLPSPPPPSPSPLPASLPPSPNPPSQPRPPEISSSSGVSSSERYSAALSTASAPGYGNTPAASLEQGQSTGPATDSVDQLLSSSLVKLGLLLAGILAIGTALAVAHNGWSMPGAHSRLESSDDPVGVKKLKDTKTCREEEGLALQGESVQPSNTASPRVESEETRAKRQQLADSAASQSGEE